MSRERKVAGSEEKVVLARGKGGLAARKRRRSAEKKVVEAGRAHKPPKGLPGPLDERFSVAITLPHAP